MNPHSPVRRLLSLSALLFLLAVPLAISSAQEQPAQPAPPEQPLPELPPAAAVEGTWKVTPLAQQGAAEAGSTSFPEFGAAVWVDSGELVFWARAGNDKDRGQWELLSLKNGQTRRIAQHDVEFTEPDGFKKKIRRGFGGYYPAGKILYVNIPLGRLGLDSNVYIWDGERLNKVLAKEDSLQIGSTSYTLDSAAVIGVRRDGVAMISYRTDKPKKTGGCLLHDGTRLVVTPLPDPLPGLPGISPDVEGEVSYCPQYPGGSLFFMKVKGAPYKSAIFYLTPQKVEKLVSSEDPDPFQEGKKLGFAWPPHIWPTGPETALILGPLWSGKQGLEITAFAWEQGKLKPIRGFLRESKGFNQYDLGYVYFPHPSELEVLFTVMLQNYNSWAGRISRILPDMYHFDGERLRPVQWEAVLGKDIGQLSKGTGSLLDLAFYGLPRRIEMRAVPGQARGVILEMPVKKDDPKRTWYLDTNAKELKLTRVPEFKTTSGQIFALDDVFAWKSETEALVRTEDGFFLLTRQ
jgi:hypothetical protein